MSERRNAFFRVSPELLRKALHMPEGTEIYGAEWHFREDDVVLYLTHPEIDPVPEGQTIPQIRMMITEYTRILKDEEGNEVMHHTYDGKFS